MDSTKYSIFPYWNFAFGFGKSVNDSLLYFEIYYHTKNSSGSGNLLIYYFIYVLFRKLIFNLILWY